VRGFCAQGIVSADATIHISTAGCRPKASPPGRTRWVRPRRAGFFLPKQVLSEVFRGKFTEGLRCLFRRKKLAFHRP
jgi:hypothetical protein